MIMYGGFFFFFQAEDGIRDRDVTGVQTCALPISSEKAFPKGPHQGHRGQPPCQDHFVPRFHPTSRLQRRHPPSAQQTRRLQSATGFRRPQTDIGFASALSRFGVWFNGVSKSTGVEEADAMVMLRQDAQ